jgi:methylated-DNA-[protein]-cysteine S-methyltransferase
MVSTDIEWYRSVTPWGELRLATRGEHVVSIRPPLDGDMSLRGECQPMTSAPAAAQRLAASIARYLGGEQVELATRDDVEAWLDAAGVDGFRRDASLTLFDVPRGVTLSYGELAALAGRPGAARAAGSTCARNPLPLVVPCHRVVNAGARHGDVGSYGAASGTAYKRRLLELEDAALVRPVQRR